MKWLVKLTAGHPGEEVTADRYRMDAGGSLVLTDGDVFQQRLVRAYSPNAWHSVAPVQEPSTPETRAAAVRSVR